MNTSPSTSNPTLKRKAKKKPQRAKAGQRRLTTGEDLIRQKLLLSKWNELKARGVRLRGADIERQQKCSPSLPYQYLNGDIPLNEKWMLIFAQYMQLTPQEIWAKHWPYPNLTPIFCPDGAEDVVFHFGKVLMVFRRIPASRIAAVARELTGVIKRIPAELKQVQAA